MPDRAKTPRNRVISCQNLHKSYRVGHARKKVLNGIDLEIRPGDRIALLGRNGAGKSTLIKQLGGVEIPDKGCIVRGMTISWPIGFNGGFQGSLTGLDNARFIARIYGRSYRDMREFVEDFTELGRSLAMPVKTYSSGMRARLAFALSLAIEFDCYLIDEIILVGDQRFQDKCRTELFQKREDRAMLIASHDMTFVEEECNRAVVIENGQATEYEQITEAMDVYRSL